MLLRVMRILRIVRILRLLRGAKELRNLIMTMIYSFPSLVNVSSILALTVFIYAVLGVDLFTYLKPQEHLDASRNFYDLGHAALTLFQCLTNDAWSGLMADAMLDESTGKCSEAEGDCGSWVAIPYFISFQVIGSFVFLNLVVAVILENFTTEQELSPKEARALGAPDVRARYALYTIREHTRDYIERKNTPSPVKAEMIRPTTPPPMAGKAAAAPAPAPAASPAKNGRNRCGGAKAAAGAVAKAAARPDAARAAGGGGGGKASASPPKGKSSAAAPSAAPPKPKPSASPPKSKPSPPPPPPPPNPSAQALEALDAARSGGALPAKAAEPTPVKGPKKRAEAGGLTAPPPQPEAPRPAAPEKVAPAKKAPAKPAPAKATPQKAAPASGAAQGGAGAVAPQAQSGGAAANDARPKATTSKAAAAAAAPPPPVPVAAEPPTESKTSPPKGARERSSPPRESSSPSAGTQYYVARPSSRNSSRNASPSTRRDYINPLETAKGVKNVRERIRSRGF